jgi:phosphoribosylamine--glycine ligase
VVKADGLAAGKGVIIAHTEAEAKAAIARLGPAVIIEEFLQGEEVSFIGLSDGHSVLAFPPTQDHKRALDNDEGPNTGGMGAYLDGRILTVAQEADIMDRIMLPAIARMRAEGTPFTGFLYAGLMLTPDGPKVLEFNVRLGDPETQVLLHGFEGDLAQLLEGVASGETGLSIPRPQYTSVCVVMAAEGYPDDPRIGDLITGLDEAEPLGATVFHAGTKRSGDQFLTAGGRVLGVTASGHSLPAAISSAYRAVEKIHFRGAHYRQDIASKGLRRW